MQFTVLHALGLEKFRQLQLVAGEKGLSREITKIGILDYEFTTKTESFYIKGEFVVTSFLYAKDDEKLILDAVKALNGCGASGLAIKSVFFNSLPQQVIDYANAHRFPIFTFGVPVYFEDLIAEFAYFKREFSSYNRYEELIENMLEKSLTEDEISVIAGNIHKRINPFMFMAYLWDGKRNSQPDFIKYLKIFHDTLPEDCCAIKYRNGFLILFSFTVHPGAALQLIVQKAVKKARLDMTGFCTGISEVQNGQHKFKRVVEQSLDAVRVCRIQTLDAIYYGDIGIYKLLIPSLKNPYVREFSQDIVNRLNIYDCQNNTLLLETAMAYVFCGGNIKKTAKHLFQHENTIRYRVNKIKELFVNAASDELMFEELAAAIQIHQLLEDNWEKLE